MNQDVKSSFDGSVLVAIQQATHDAALAFARKLVDAPTVTLNLTIGITVSETSTNYALRCEVDSEPKH